ncbi:GTPase Der [Iodidimonas nitroreducens]|uniref:GTPase Der n=1 Tax=Iodidimonas nitroreducens TaxID=1236968 RepID=A0A5A7N3Z9_9PROT|nr:ribosome biogenesis GTPase Der [Iodidimonas nitroreducens]GAK34043.1 GTPase Der [alpha proteobacterium Q-1]GER02858.1 GTPase Der [Iodidimonas nitroreducens]
MSKQPLTIAIIGRPNVGKSTLFNRLVGKRLALVDDTPGVTRDRRMGVGKLADLRFDIIDTAGLEEGDSTSLAGRMRLQTEAALGGAHMVLFMIDARAGITPLDRHFASWLRVQKIPVILVANKAEGTRGTEGAYEAYALGLGDPVALSAEHAEGLGDLYSAIDETARLIGVDPRAVEQHTASDTDDAAEDLVEGDLDFEFEDDEADDDVIAFTEERPLRLAVIGRPNAGKSTLINYLVGEERLITGPEAGLTRDSISVDWDYGDIPVRLFDTAGLRRRSRVIEKLEKLSVADTLRAVRFAEIVVLMIDAERGVDKQDIKIASLVVEEGRALVIALNKWDQVEDRLAAQRGVNDILTRSLPQLKGVTTVPVSALTGQGIERLMPAVIDAYELWNSRIRTSEFNRWLAAVTESHPPPAVQGRATRMRYGAQIKARPPTFTIFTNHPAGVPDSYMRYLENEMRRDFGLAGVPLRLYLRASKNPYVDGRRTQKQRLTEKNNRRGK